MIPKIPLFLNDCPDCIIPIGLYTARLSRLEAFTNDLRDLPIKAYYEQGSRRLDPELDAYYGRITQVVPENVIPANSCIAGSGFGTVEVAWNEGGIDRLNPWEVELDGAGDQSPPTRPSLSEDEKKRVREALAQVKSAPRVSDLFEAAVDESLFSDYSTRVEVQMDLSLISKRLEADYYATRFATVSDVKTIRDNCAKFNGENDELTEIADGMLSTFQSLVLTEEELSSMLGFQSAVESMVAQRSTSGDNTQRTNTIATTQVRRRRRVARTRSALETLGDPVVNRDGGQRRDSSGSRRRSRSERPSVGLQPRPARSRSSRERGLSRRGRGSLGNQPSRTSTRLAEADRRDEEARGLRRSRRSTREGGGRTNYHIYTDSELSDQAATPEVSRRSRTSAAIPSRTRATRAISIQTNGSGRTNSQTQSSEISPEQIDDTQESISRPTRRSSRRNSAVNESSASSDDDVHSTEKAGEDAGVESEDYQSPDEESESESSAGPRKMPAKRDRGQATRIASHDGPRALITRSSSRRSKPHAQSYQDPSSSEFSSDSDGDASSGRRHSTRKPARKKAKTGKSVTRVDSG